MTDEEFDEEFGDGIDEDETSIMCVIMKIGSDFVMGLITNTEDTSFEIKFPKYVSYKDTNLKFVSYAPPTCVSDVVSIQLSSIESVMTPIDMVYDAYISIVKEESPEFFNSLSEIGQDSTEIQALSLTLH